MSLFQFNKMFCLKNHIFTFSGSFGHQAVRSWVKHQESTEQELHSVAAPAPQK
jgi:hypothetical protein